jgi:hypothetical protein
LEVIHDGAEASRTEKIVRRIAGSALALETLNVCWEGEPGRNCGACDKCLRTMIGLELAGCLGACSTLPSALDLDAVHATLLAGPEHDVDLRALSADAKRYNRDDIFEVIEHCRQPHPKEPGLV